MVKFNQPTEAPRATPTVTHEGGSAWQPPTLTELAFTAACTYSGEDTFYESAQVRQDRLVELVRRAVDTDPAAVARFVPELRDRYLIRSASVVVACEYAYRVRELGYPDYAPDVADVIAAACSRADEPAEVVAYWRAKWGVERAGRRRASLPAGVRKGLARACERLYTPAAALKWSGSGAVHPGDVVELAHPEPRDQEQRSLFKWLLDQRRHGDAGPAEDAGRVKLDHSVLEDVRTLRLSREVGQVPEGERREYLRRVGPDALAAAGYTWERLSGWLPGGMDREAWEAVLPRMGVMALLRNLRNFDDVGIGREARATVVAKLTSPEDVVASRVLPYRVYTAYNQAPSDEWKLALGTTLDLASASAPELDGAVLCIDTSASMRTGGVSRRSVVTPVTIAALQAATLAKRGTNVDVVLFGDRSVSLDQVDPQWRRKSTLAVVQTVERSIGIVGHATFGDTAIAQHFDPARHRQAVVFTDGQFHDNERLVQHVPHITAFLVGGYGTVPHWGPGRVTVSGFSDQVLRVVAEHVRAGVVTGSTR